MLRNPGKTPTAVFLILIIPTEIRSTYLFPTVLMFSNLVIINLIFVGFILLYIIIISLLVEDRVFLSLPRHPLS